MCTYPPTSEESLDAWLSQGQNREQSGVYSDWKLEPVHRCLLALGLSRLPRPITFAGTKGKGSILAFTEGVLLAHRRPCVAFSSPHVLALNERWRLDGRACDYAFIGRFCPQVDAALAACDYGASYFERSFLLACCLADAYPDALMLCEVGLGGRLDCANLLHARLVCLSSLGLDHTQVLGPSLDHIAREKLAVCRKDAPLLVAAQSAEADAAIDRQCPAEIALRRIPPLDPCAPLGLQGAHQAANAAVALAAVALLLDSDYQSSLAQAGLAQAWLPGRCQSLRWNGRDFLIDGAHTAESMRASLATAATLFEQDYLLILGIARDKNIAAVCREIPAGLRVLRCGYDCTRSAQADDPAWPDQAWPWVANMAEALQHPLFREQSQILISGSFYLAGEALRLLQGCTLNSFIGLTDANQESKITQRL